MFLLCYYRNLKSKLVKLKTPQSRKKYYFDASAKM